MNWVADYLKIPFEYGQALGGLRWSADGDAVETIPTNDEPPRTFVVTPALMRLIEGFSAEAELPNIGFLLHFLRLLGASMHNTGRLPPEAVRLEQAFRATGRIMRNAGALCAELCIDLPRAAGSIDAAAVVTVLDRPRWNHSLARAYASSYDLAEVPPLTPTEFESRLLQRVAALSDHELRHWMRHGRGSIGDAGRQVARLAPPELLETLTALELRPRLAGAARLVPALAGAFSLPPRRLAHSELPSGGYTDLATRGHPEQILPAQFALDDVEFLRRFAARELLYFHRETPHQPTAEQVLLLIDQGVRTWGDVRLVLAAAALALGRQALRRGRALLLSATSLNGRIIDAALSDRDALGTALEASDLSTHPAEALARVLEAPAEGLRDVVLLTHPRSLREPEVIAAARGAAAGTRVFGVSVDGEGEVALAELRGGIPVGLARCRVDIRSPVAVEPSQRPVTRGEGAWHGDVEPVPYPFRLGALQRFRDDMFVFDDTGEWLLLAAAPGLLHVWKLDGSHAEVLPRAWVDGAPLHRVEVLLGVAGGFVVAGTNGKELVLAHYELARRTLTAHRLGIMHGPAERIWWYDRRHHSVVGCRKSSRYVIYAVDLAAPSSEACFRRWLPEANVALRARAAANAPPPEDDVRPLVLRLGDTLPENGRLVCLEPSGGSLSARADDGRWIHIPLQDDGRPPLKGATVIDVQWRGPVLAVLANLATQKSRRLLVLHQELGRKVADLAVEPGVESFALARDGQRFAFRVNKRELAIHEIGRYSPLFVTPQSKSHSRLEVELGPSLLVVRTSKFTHLVRWDRGPLRFVVSQQPTRGLLDEQFDGEAPATAWSRLLGSSQVVRDERFDNKRFVSAAWSGGLGALVDSAGHVVIIDMAGAVVCIFHVYRLQLSAWMPDGTKLGPASFIGGPPTPDGAARMAEALRAAAGSVEEVAP